MKFLPQHPFALLALGSVVGAGSVLTVWLSGVSAPSGKEKTLQPQLGHYASARSKSPAVVNLQSSSRMEDRGREMAGKDPQGGWRHSLEMKNFSERLAFMSGLLHELAKKDPMAAMEMAASLPAGRLKKEAYDAACAGWASVDPDGASKWATGNLSGPVATEAFGMIAREWAGADPAAAAVWVSTLPNGLLSEGPTSALVSIWAEKDPTAASKWIEAMATGDRKTGAMEVLAAAWCEQSVDEAVQWVNQQIDKPGGRDVAEALLGAWGNQDPAAASQWVMTLQGDVQAVSAGTLLSLWAASDPKVASEWASQFPPGLTRSQAIPSIASTWAGTEPQNAISWTQSLPDSPEKQEAYDDAVRTWSVVSPADLTAWVNRQSTGEDADHLRSIASGAMVEANPLDAIAMTDQIGDATRRQSMLIHVLNRWGQIDAGAAQSWMAGANLPPAVTGHVKIVPQPVQ